jgi:putative tricarboxylic transport membrane protein
VSRLRRVPLGVAIAAIICAVLGIGAAFEAVRMGVWRGRSPGEGLYPLMAALAVVVLSAAYALQATAEPAPDAALETPEPVNLGKLAYYLGGLAAFAFLLDPLGYLLVLPTVLFVILVLAERLPAGMAAMVSAATAAVTHVVFERLLALPLPRGPF